MLRRVKRFGPVNRPLTSQSTCLFNRFAPLFGEVAIGRLTGESTHYLRLALPGKSMARQRVCLGLKISLAWSKDCSQRAGEPAAKRDLQPPPKSATCDTPIFNLVNHLPEGRSKADAALLPLGTAPNHKSIKLAKYSPRAAIDGFGNHLYAPERN
jgi:hypothetical protein